MFPARFSIVTYNLWGVERWLEREPAVRLFCELYRPDVLCVQELTPGTRLVIDDALPGHIRVEDSFGGWATESNIWWNITLFEVLAYGAEEVGIVRYERGRRIAEYQQLIDPQRRISAGVTALTGITQEMVSRQPRFADQIPRTGRPPV